MTEDAVWDDLVGDPWIRFDEVIDRHGGPFGTAAMDALEPLAAATALDVGCGTGSTTWALADRVGPNGRAIGVDLSDTFLAAARLRRERDPRVSFVHGDAAEVRTDDELDCLFSRFGIMFFPEPVAAFAHLRSLVRPGGRMAFACWQGPGENPWMSAPVMASASVLGPPQLPPPGAPGPFAFAAADTVHAVLADAGWSAIEVEGLARDSHFIAGGATAMADMVTQTHPVLAAGMRDHPERRDELLAAVADAVRQYERDGEIVVPAAAWIVRATAP